MTKLYEYSSIGEQKVDRERCIIPGVKILGRTSKNGREYSDKALREAAAKYEGVDVNVNHPDRSKPHAERKIEDAMGWLEAVEIRPDGVYGNLHYLKEHPSSALVAEVAERRSTRLGLSHNAEGTVAKSGNKNVVESIERVLSVDLVQRPATNEGLFESEFVTIREVLTNQAPELLTSLLEDGALLPPDALDAPMDPMTGAAEDATATVKAAMAQIITAMLDLPGDLRAMCSQLLPVFQKIVAGQPEPEADPNADPENPEEDPNDPATDPNAEKDPSAEADPANPFKKKDKNMAESTKPKSVEERLALLEAENAALREKDELHELEKKYTKLLMEHKREVLPHRLTALANAPDDTVRIALIEDWPSNEEPIPEPEPRRRPNFSAPLRESSKSTDSMKFPETHEGFISSLR